jgi:tetratricopeptide (TPR) repeat protein
MVWVLAHQKKHEAALIYCDKAIEIEPEYVYALSYKGLLLFECGKLDEALKYYDRALKIDPSNIRALHYKNKILGKIKKSKRPHFFAK